MLVETPTNLVDMKPRVISEIRKPFVQRSPSLDDLPRLSGTLNYYCNILGIWSQKQVCVRDGCLLVYQDTPSFLQTPVRGYASLGRPISRRTPLQHTRSDSSGTPSSMDYLVYSGSQSLGRARGAALAGLEFRLPLRHLNLMPSSTAPLAFTLSHQQNGNVPYVTFQALNELDYDRWVKTLAVEIMRQTPLEAIRFLDVLGIASFSTPSTKSCVASPTVLSCKSKPVVDDKYSNMRGTMTTTQTMVRWDRSPSSEGSTTSADFATQENKYDSSQSIISRPKRLSNTGHSLPRRKLCLKNNDGYSDNHLEVCKEKDIINNGNSPVSTKIATSGRKSREKIRRYREKNGNGSSSEETRTIDEGIVLEERGSSSERSCRRTLWPSDRSDCLDSPHSVSSYSSYELCESPETVSLGDELLQSNETNLIKNNASVDEPDCKIRETNHEQVSERIYCKNIVSPKTCQENLLKKKCDRKVASVKTISEGKKLFLEAMSQGDNLTSLIEIPLFHAQPYYDTTDTNTIPEDKIINSKEYHLECSSTALTAPNTNHNNINLQYSSKSIWNRARSCSPSNRSPGSDGRGARALSAGQPSSTRLLSCVEILKRRCQNTENYVPVKEKLVLFESLCHAGRLARSSEELAGELFESTAPRARSLHDLTRERSPHVREMCEFFEKFGQGANKSAKDKSVSKQRRYSENSKEKLIKSNNCKTSSHNKTLYKSLNDINAHNNNMAYHQEPMSLDSLNKININTMKYKVKPYYEIPEEDCGNDAIDAVNMKVQNDSSLCDAFQFGHFKQIRLGNKIITYV